MSHVRLKGINSVTHTRADGHKLVYDYAWKGGPRFRGKRGSPEYIASYNEAIAHRTQPADGVMLAILNAYQASADFTSLPRAPAPTMSR